MPFIPHTQEEIQEMLEVIGIKKIDSLFDEIPSSLRKQAFDDQVPSGISEMELSQRMQARAAQDANLMCFIGAGSYEHYIPAAVWDVTTRGEFMTAYTPYQAEASQGSLQLIYEYQTMMCALMAMEVSNASLYEGASSLAEAILMAVRLSKSHKKRILMPRTIHPHYRHTVETIVRQQAIEIIEVPYNAETGQTDITALSLLLTDDVAALVIPQPNFFGVLENVDELADWAHANQILSIAVVNPLAMALLKPPGEWGKDGVDIACGDGQPLGVPLSSGGPYYGFLACKKNHVRQMPGRIVGKTVDIHSKPGYVLTLQAREQHIRRGKATSNICTNQGLMVTASTIYMSLMGPQGLRQVAMSSHQHARELYELLTAIPEVTAVFTGPFFHEIVLCLKRPVADVLHSLASVQIQGGFALEAAYPELKDCLLVCVTETKSSEEMKQFANQLAQILQERKLACHA